MIVGKGPYLALKELHRRQGDGGNRRLSASIDASRDVCAIRLERT
jgi:hypothetical protein